MSDDLNVKIFADIRGIKDAKATLDEIVHGDGKYDETCIEQIPCRAEK